MPLDLDTIYNRSGPEAEGSQRIEYMKTGDNKGTAVMRQTAFQGYAYSPMLNTAKNEHAAFGKFQSLHPHTQLSSPEFHIPELMTDSPENTTGQDNSYLMIVTNKARKNLLSSLYGVFGNPDNRKSRKRKDKEEMGKKNKDTDISDLIELMGRRSGLRRLFYRNIENLTNLAMGVAADTFHEFAENNLYATLTIFGHYDTFISKSSVKVLLKYLWPKYGKHILMDVDGNFSMCSISIEKIRKSVLGFPELVNKTIRPGIYWVKVSDVGKGTYMIVIKNKLYSEGDISENGIRSEAKNFKTTIMFVGERKIPWKRRVQKEIDGYCSGLVTTSASSDKIRVQSLGGGENAQNDIIIRPMQNLMFPEKEALLSRIQTFLDSEKIYKENGIPYRKGFLFTGPRGTGKTSFAFSLANHFQMECVSVDLSYFDTNGGANAFNGHNTIYIIDEIDAQLPKSRVAETHEAITVDQQKIIDRLHKLLKAMDDMTDGCIIIGTTNFPDRLDPAIVRSGRFDERVDFDNLDKKFATMMCSNRGLDSKTILEGETFPINPAYLEQKLIAALLEKNNIQRKDLKSADEIIREEYGLEVPAEESGQEIVIEEPPTAATYVAQENLYVASVPGSSGKSSASNDLEETTVTGRYVNPDVIEAVEDIPDNDSQEEPDENAERRIEVVQSGENDARMVTDNEDEEEE